MDGVPHVAISCDILVATRPNKRNFAQRQKENKHVPTRTVGPVPSKYMGHSSTAGQKDVFGFTGMR